MPRIVGVDVPGDKRVAVALTRIYGIGRTSAGQVCEVLGVDEEKRAHELSEDELSRLGSYIDKNFVTEGELRRLESENINRLRKIGCYRGIRHRKGLPVRGQRTRTNARTRKGKRRTVASKKGIKEVAH